MTSRPKQGEECLVGNESLDHHRKALGSPIKSYLKSKRKKFRDVQRGKILNFLDRNVGDEHGHDALSESQSSVAKYQFPSLNSVVTTTAASSQASLLTPPISPQNEPPQFVVGTRRPSIVNLFRRDGRSSQSRTRNAAPSIPTAALHRKKSHSTTTIPNDLELIQLNYVVDQILKCYTKSPCKTFEDHKEFAMEELIQHANSLCLTPTRVGKLRGLVEHRLKEHLRLDEDSKLDEHDEIDSSEHVLGVHRRRSQSSPGRVRRSSVGPSFGDDAPVEDALRTRNLSSNLLNDGAVRRRRGRLSPLPPAPKQGVHRRSSLTYTDQGSIELRTTVSSSTLRAPSPRPLDPKSPRRRRGSNPDPSPLISRSLEKNNPQEAAIEHEVSNVKLTDTAGHLGSYTGTISIKTDKPHGQGRMLYRSPDKDYAISYEGEWNQGQWNGYGVVVRKNGDTYTGSFSDDQFHGHGEYIHKESKRVFQGRYVMGHRIEGIMKYSDGSVYEGGWYSGKRQGKGVYRFSDGSKFKGEFVDDQMSGYGQLIWPDGSRFVGEFQRGRRHGKGKEYDERGRIRYEGFFRNNLPLSDDAVITRNDSS